MQVIYLAGGCAFQYLISRSDSYHMHLGFILFLSLIVRVELLIFSAVFDEDSITGFATSIQSLPFSKLIFYTFYTHE
jgi:hypothetical protein